jgi:hypothetical protein
MLRYRAVVPNNSGAFKILKDAQHDVFMSYRERWNELQVVNFITATKTALQQIFSKGACPCDLNEHGEGLFSV